MIKLSNGGSFNEKDLIKYIKKTKALETFIVQGQTVKIFTQHPKVLSLDFWIRRQKGVSQNTKQADNEVVKQLVATNLFMLSDVTCPESGKKCKGLKLSAASTKSKTKHKKQKS